MDHLQARRVIVFRQKKYFASIKLNSFLGPNYLLRHLDTVSIPERGVPVYVEKLDFFFLMGYNFSSIDFMILN